MLCRDAAERIVAPLEACRHGRVRLCIRVLQLVLAVAALAVMASVSACELTSDLRCLLFTIAVRAFFLFPDRWPAS